MVTAVVERLRPAFRMMTLGFLFSVLGLRFRLLLLLLAILGLTFCRASVNEHLIILYFTSGREWFQTRAVGR